MKPVGAGHVDRSRADADRGGPGVAQERGRAWRETQAAAGSPSDGRSRPAPSLWPGRQPTDVRADPGPGLRPQPASTVAGSEQQLLRGWRSVMLAPVGDGPRRRRGSDGMRLAGAVLALVCCVLVIRYDSRIDRAITAVIHPPPRTITWLVTVVYQAGSFGVVIVGLGVALLACRW